MIYNERQLLIMEETMILSEGIKEAIKKGNRAAMLDPQIFKEKFEELKKQDDVKGVKKLLSSYSVSISEGEIKKFLVKDVKNNLPKLKREILKAEAYIKQHEPDYDFKKTVVTGRITYGALLLGAIALSAII